MPPLPSKRALQEMPRPELQRLCKDYGVKANLKTDALIELLLDTKKSNTRTAPPPPTRRSVSTRTTSRSAPRISSVIIHDTDDEDEDNDPQVDEEEIENKPEPDPEPVSAAPRTRKAKETQLRLGVGRPVQAGGSGPRAVTRSLSVAKGKRGKNSKALKAVEETIQEEEEEQPPQAGPSEPTVAGPASAPEPTPDQNADNSALSIAIAEALQPVYQQLAQLPLLKNELAQLRKQVADMHTLDQKVAALTAQLDSQTATIAALTVELRQLKDAPRLGLSTSTPRFQRPSSPYGNAAAGSSKRIDPIKNDDLPNPGIAPSMLGKRHRDSTTSNLTGVIEAGQEEGLDEEELAKRVVRPMKKRAKLQGDEELEDPHNFVVHEDVPQRVPSFTVFSGEEEEPYVDPPPPTQGLLDFFAPPSPPPASGSGSGSGPRRAGGTTTTSTQHASENQHPFSYAFLPLSSTPVHADFTLPSFPYPEPPQSPSPESGAGPSRTRGGGGGGGGERTDIFEPFGLPPPGRPRSRMTSTSAPRDTNTNTTVDPAALTRQQQQDGPGVDNNASAMKTQRTMYGTELDVDTRFGDFGLEGVASGFWPGGSGRF